ncbi:methyl-accepting chemotaxis protein [Synechocystis salina]|uniref:HAMP domain-containing protein n=1 Tax=Synechocystis salina LEGE 00031 TaxID=1828736 RepID=A0ABR9VYC5_9SYNC|nr:methyl-accepting chemotaxis protein [Synechocystis salina]MBE9241981.1 HAMP domain-containing protein [Synechocystis salina LEGE 00041]MBE9255231.1 HAMP domain-containing protein [Synechocystis salina LEGE 00031]
MATETNFSQLYGLAYAAYGQGNYQEASSHIEQLAADFPEDPNVLLLRGHIYVGLEQYALAHQAYQGVIRLSDRQDLIDCANQALGQIKEEGPGGNGAKDSFGQDWQSEVDSVDRSMAWETGIFTEEDFGEPTLGSVPTPTNPGMDRPFGRSSGSGSFSTSGARSYEIENLDWSPEAFTDDLDSDDEQTMMPQTGESTFVVPPAFGEGIADFADLAADVSAAGIGGTEGTEHPQYQAWDGGDWSEALGLDDPEALAAAPTPTSGNYGAGNNLPSFDAFEEGVDDELSDFNLTDIAPELPDSSLFTQTTGLDMSPVDRVNDTQGGDAVDHGGNAPQPGMATWLKPEGAATGDLSSATSPFNDRPTSEVDAGFLGWFTNASLFKKQIYMAIASGVFSGFVVLVLGSIVGLGGAPQNVPAPPGETTTEAPAEGAPAEGQAPEKEPGKASLLNLALLTAIATAIGVFLINRLLMQQIKSIIDDLQNQFESIYEGNFNVRAKVRSEDELGALTQRFNYISQVILTATSEAQERAATTEKVREKLQRQVIRLLDDVEGASRGDLTVQAEVTADELGAVADAFNLTIQNLREIVLQVKNAAKQVNNNCKDSESFARNNSSDALRMAEELAVTLNSVQLMTESIERVAENAREAEEVAHTSSLTALKGGEAVERTVGGILQIRETVSETARKVKRLAEASQEISKIVAVISQIASRTNLLALNASIQAARAGEAGRGFAIVADEVRQLADRSAKSLKEIEQIVLQIQSETGSVMTAMEEGIQQVIDVTDKSEQSKRALEDIIEVSNRINTLVRSITADTVKQQENSGAVSNVMQSIELTAQETSQESQRVAGSLQTLVSISRDLLTSVERFRVENR